MPNETLGLADAKRMLSAAEAKAETFGIAYNIAVVDAGAHLIAFVRQDEGLIGSIDLAIKKAITARIAAPKLPDGDGYLAALINFRFMANGIWSTDETVAKLLVNAG